MNRESYMKLLEEISLNAWPSHKIELYDGWLIRFSHNYTHRTNSVEQVGASQIPIEEKIAYCEAMYANYHTPAIFKINPLLDPSFDRLLAEKGYEIQHTTEVMTMDMNNMRLEEPLSVGNTNIMAAIPACPPVSVSQTTLLYSSGTGLRMNGFLLCSA